MCPAAALPLQLHDALLFPVSGQLSQRLESGSQADLEIWQACTASACRHQLMPGSPGQAAVALYVQMKFPCCAAKEA